MRARAAAGSGLFLAIAPGVVAGAIPYWLTGWEAYDAPFALRVAGAALIAAGVPVLLHSFGRFVVEGIGTPAPVAPTEHLVVGGLYRYVRNPMYLAVVATILGQAALLGRPVLLVWAPWRAPRCGRSRAATRSPPSPSASATSTSATAAACRAGCRGSEVAGVGGHVDGVLGSTSSGTISSARSWVEASTTGAAARPGGPAASSPR